MTSGEVISDLKDSRSHPALHVLVGLSPEEANNIRSAYAELDDRSKDAVNFWLAHVCKHGDFAQVQSVLKLVPRFAELAPTPTQLMLTRNEDLRPLIRAAGCASIGQMKRQQQANFRAAMGKLNAVEKQERIRVAFGDIPLDLSGNRWMKFYLLEQTFLENCAASQRRAVFSSATVLFQPRGLE